MKNIKRPFAALGVGALLAFSVTACGGGGAPTDASVEDFCGLEADLEAGFGDIASGDFEKLSEGLADAAEAAEEVGTPEDISDEAREGFEILVASLQDLDADGLETSMTDLRDAAAAGEDIGDENAMMAKIFDVSEEDVEKVSAFIDYSEETC